MTAGVMVCFYHHHTSKINKVRKSKTKIKIYAGFGVFNTENPDNASWSVIHFSKFILYDQRPCLYHIIVLSWLLSLFFRLFDWFKLLCFMAFCWNL